MDVHVTRRDSYVPTPIRGILWEGAVCTWHANALVPLRVLTGVQNTRHVDDAVFYDIDSIPVRLSWIHWLRPPRLSL